VWRRAVGSVANFAQEAMKGQVPLSVWELCREGVEQLGRSEALFSGLHHHLSFLKPPHNFLSAGGELTRPCLVDTSSMGNQGRIAAGGNPC
jgi:hypothetical protein